MRDRTAGGRLPKDWWNKTEQELGQWFDHALEREGRVAESTFWAIHYAIKTEGEAGFQRRATDIANMSISQIEEMAVQLAKVRAPHSLIDTLLGMLE